MWGFLFVGLLVVGWIIYKSIMARNIKGASLEIKPFRKNSPIAHFTHLELTVDKTMNPTPQQIWFYCGLMDMQKVGNEEFDYVLIRAKSEDDNINRKKPVVCYFKIGNNKTGSEKFVDWAWIKAK